ncbi:lytic transglycosylase domain-containing protein [Actinomadura sp. BRA 177]|uniref:lytic transglycosylase domain-containing protein n=1 Tax=Actinomadura sp. BRA 177 TaxID=2745202 RepID=UPI001595B1BF|nr:lytic transglycosylase domain-containing protein [Actinomadura sp. BRA 177]NVI87753.1 lytic transglycosylase domain-containing protein [Actinomadura sp. BRA 177]
MASPSASRTGPVAETSGDGEAPAARPPRPKPEKKRRDPRKGRGPARRGRALPFLIGGIAVLAIASTSGGVYAALTTEKKAEPAASDTPEEAPPTAGDPVNVATGGQVAPLRRVVPPDVLAVGGGSISAAKIKRIAKMSRVKDVAAVAGGAVQLQGRQVNAFAVDPSAFRSWTPPGTAKKTELWEALAANQFVVSPAAAEQLQLTRGYQYPVVARTMPKLTMGGSGALGLPGIDMLVSKKSGEEMGLVPNVAVLVNAPGVSPAKVVKAVTKVLGPGTNVLNLHESKYQSSGGGRSASYLDLYKQAATTCPGLSWTVLAAIGQVESDHGRNTGPSSAGALGPMQFMPATWKAYGVDGDNDGKADIMNPFDAIPGAAKYLCANGAGRGGKQLYNAVWHYNHADWYVQKVLNLAKAYAAKYD